MSVFIRVHLLFCLKDVLFLYTDQIYLERRQLFFVVALSFKYSVGRFMTLFIYLIVIFQLVCCYCLTFMCK